MSNERFSNEPPSTAIDCFYVIYYLNTWVPDARCHEASSHSGRKRSGTSTWQPPICVARSRPENTNTSQSSPVFIALLTHPPRKGVFSHPTVCNLPSFSSKNEQKWNNEITGSGISNCINGSSRPLQLNPENNVSHFPFRWLASISNPSCPWKIRLLVFLFYLRKMREIYLSQRAPFFPPRGFGSN